MFKNLFVALVIATSFLLAPTLLAANNLPTPSNTLQPLDAIVATVNQHIITQTDFTEALNFAKQRTKAQGMTISEKDLRQQVLQGLIDRQLQLQLAKQNKMKASDAEVDAAIQSIAKQNHASISELKAQLSQHGISYKAFRKNMAEQVLIQKLQQQVVSNNINITPADIKAFRQKYANDPSGMEYHVMDYLVAINNVNDAAEKNKAHTQALDLLRTLNSGTGVKAVMKKYGASADDLGWRRLSDLPSEFVRPIAATPAGGISGPILAPNGYHLLKVVKKRSQVNNLSNDQVNNMIMQQKYQKAIQDWLSTLHKNAYIKINPAYQ